MTIGQLPLAGWWRRHLAATGDPGDMLTVRLMAWICTRTGRRLLGNCLHSGTGGRRRRLTASLGTR